MIAGELSLDQLLGRVADAARMLTGAGHVTVEVCSARTGSTAACAECAGRRSTADGDAVVVLDALIRTRGVAFARLHTGAATGRSFGDRERSQLARLAAVAGTAVANTQLYQETEQQRRWSVEAAALMQSLLTAQTVDPIRTVLERTCTDLDADLATLDLVVDDSTLVVEAAAGPSAPALVGRRFVRSGDPADEVLRSGRPRLGNDFDGRPVVADLDLGPYAVVPLVGDNRTRGVLTVARLGPRDSFTEEDVDHLAGYARFAGLALDLARARRDHEIVRSLQIRDRIAAELRDQVVRQAFAVGMRLEGVLELITEPLARERVRACVAELDAMVREIRDTVYRLDEEGDSRR